MAYGLPLYALPTDDVGPDATWSVSSGTVNAEYPASYLGNRNPAKPAKLTGTSGTWTATFGASRVLVGVALINHNFAGATVSITSGSGMNESITIPSNGSDGICVNPWRQLTGTLGQRTSTTFNIVVSSGALGALALGEVVLLTALRDLNLKWGVKYTPTRLITRHNTWGGTRLQYDKRIRVRRANGMLDLRDDETAIRLLETAGIGGYHPWFFVPDEDVNDAWYVQHVPGSFSYALGDYGITQMPFEVQEVSMGPSLFP